MRYHIEFLGVPCSGKTTIYRQVVKNLSLNDENYISFHKGLWDSMRKHSKDSLRFLLYMVPRYLGEKKAKDIFLYLDDKNINKEEFMNDNQELTSFVQKMSAQNPEIVTNWMLDSLFSSFNFLRKNLSSEQKLVMDEGYSQRTISLFAYQNSYNTDELVRYASLIPIPDLVFVAEIDDKNRERYLNSGSRKLPYRMRSMNRKERYAFYDRSRDVIERFVAEITQRGARVVRIKNNGSIDAVAGKVVNEILRL